MKRLIKLSIVAMLATIMLTTVLPSAAREFGQQPEIVYGNCTVRSFYDDSKKKQHRLKCVGAIADGMLNLPPMVALNCDSPMQYVTFLLTGTIQYNPGEIMVRYRFDNNKETRDYWEWDRGGQYAYNNGLATARVFLVNMPVIKRIAFEVGDDSATIELDEQASDAVRDFKARCATLATE